MENKTFYISKRFVSLFKQNAMILFIIILIMFMILFPVWFVGMPISDISLSFVLIFWLPVFVFFTITCYTVVLIFSRLLKQSYVKVFPDHIEIFYCKILMWELKTNWYFEKIKEIIILKTRSGDVISIYLITRGGAELLNYGICDYDDMKDILSSIIGAIGDKVKIKTNITFLHPSHDLIERLITISWLSVNYAIAGIIGFLLSEPFMPVGTPILNGVYSLWNNSRHLFFLLIGIYLLFASYSLFNLRLFSLEKDVIRLEIKNMIWFLLLLLSGGILLYMSMIY